MSVYSVQLYAGSVPGSLTTFYTAPAGAVIVVRDIDAFLNTAPSALYYIGVQHSGTIVPLIGAASGTALTQHQWEGRVVLQPGDAIVGNSGGANIVCVISGYDLT